MTQRPDQHDRDRVIADSGWGVKPDDQPANVDEAKVCSGRELTYDASDEQVVRRILRAQRQTCNAANRIVVEPGRVVIYDLNNDSFTVNGLGYGDANLLELLSALGASFDPRQLRQVKADDPHTREYPCSRAWAWGAERTG